MVFCSGTAGNGSGGIAGPAHARGLTSRAGEQKHRYRCIFTDVDALDLIMLGRRLTRIGEAVLRGSAAGPTPNGQGLVLRDVLANPGSSISEITVRTGLPQSYVSQTVAGFRDRGLLEISADARDRRRTLVRVSPQHLRDVARKGSARADAALAKALGDPGTGPAAAELIAALAEVAARLKPAQPGPILRGMSVTESGE